MTEIKTAVTSTRWERRHIWLLIILCMAAMIVLTVMSSSGSDSASEEATASSGSGSEVQVCRSANARERDAAVADATVLRVSPTANARPIFRSNGGSASDDDAHSSVDASVPLREQCREGGWARVRALSSGQRWMAGWLPAAALSKLTLDNQGHRTLRAADISWQPGSERDRTAILSVANRILREDQRCEAINGRTLLVEGEGGRRRYTITCEGPAGSFPIEFTAADARRGRSFAMAPVAVDVASADASTDSSATFSKSDAISACVDAMKAKLYQPRSAEFHTFLDTTYTVDSGRSRVTVGFSAKNGFGNEIDAVAECVFDGDQLVSATTIPG